MSLLPLSQTMPASPRVGPSEIGRLLGVSRQTVNNYRIKDKFPKGSVFRLPGSNPPHYRYDYTVIEAWYLSGGV